MRLIIRLPILENGAATAGFRRFEVMHLAGPFSAAVGTKQSGVHASEQNKETAPTGVVALPTTALWEFSCSHLLSRSWFPGFLISSFSVLCGLYR